MLGEVVGARQHCSPLRRLRLQPVLSLSKGIDLYQSLLFPNTLPSLRTTYSKFTNREYRFDVAEGWVDGAGNGDYE